MITVVEHPAYVRWIDGLRDRRAAIRIITRIQRIAATSNLGDHHSVGDGVSELRFNFGPGYRVYYTRRGNDMIILLAGGDKDNQQRDIAQAKRLAQTLEEK